ncbi:MAG: uracil-DNA glycosylase [Phycisphaerales bacterium]|nr:uracil-DNA glycosylase [Phycisphaerales bacterium]
MQSEALRNWLRNEQRLGIPLYPLPADEASRRLRALLGHSWSAPVAEAVATPQRSNGQGQPGAVPPPARISGGRTAGGSAGGRIGVVDDVDLPPLCTRELSVSEAAAALQSLDEGLVRGCRKCRLFEGRTQTVFGVGRVRPELVFVGEGPGADEDAQGEPFVGRAGQLLTRMIAAMSLTRDQVYICNVVKCRPPGNRTPEDDEMAACSPYLFRQLAILRPKVIVTLGRPASQTLLSTKTPIGKLRGVFHDFPPPELAAFGLPVAKLMPTFHPAYLLRNPPAKKEAWEDLQQVMGLLGLQTPPR